MPTGTTCALADVASVQFLFRKKDVGQSKAKVPRPFGPPQCHRIGRGFQSARLLQIASEAVLRFNPNCKIKHYCDNVKKPEFGVSFVKQFNLVLNALDNLDARRHMNRLCLAAGGDCPPCFSLCGMPVFGPCRMAC